MQFQSQCSVFFVEYCSVIKGTERLKHKTFCWLFRWVYYKVVLIWRLSKFPRTKCLHVATFPSKKKKKICLHLLKKKKKDFYIFFFCPLRKHKVILLNVNEVFFSPSLSFWLVHNVVNFLNMKPISNVHPTNKCHLVVIFGNSV